MGAVSTIAARIMKALSKAHPDASAEEVTKILSAQMKDLILAKGAKMKPEQTERALQGLIDLGPTAESRLTRQEAIKQLKDTGILTDPAVDRVYAIGSSATPKDKIKDLDFSARLDWDKIDPKRGETLADISYNPNKGKYSKLDFVDYTTANPKFSAASEQFDSLYDTALEGQKRYGPKYKWIRLLSGAAIPGGGWPPYREQD